MLISWAQLIQKMPNQNKPTRLFSILQLCIIDADSNIAPLAEIAPHILRLWKSRLTDKQIVQALRKEIDTTRYGIGYAVSILSKIS